MDEAPEFIDGEEVSGRVVATLQQDRVLMDYLDRQGVGAEQTVRLIEVLVTSRVAAINTARTPENVRKVAHAQEEIRNAVQILRKMDQEESAAFNSRFTASKGPGEASQEAIDDFFDNTFERASLTLRRSLDFLIHYFDQILAAIRARGSVDNVELDNDPNNSHSLRWLPAQENDCRTLNIAVQRTLTLIDTMQSIDELPVERLRKMLRLVSEVLTKEAYPATKYTGSSRLEGEAVDMESVLRLLEKTA